MHATITPMPLSGTLLGGGRWVMQQDTQSDYLTNSLDSVCSVDTPRKLASGGVARISG